MSKLTYKTAEEWVKNVLPRFKGRLTLEGEILVPIKSRFNTLGYIARSLTRRKIDDYDYFIIGNAIGLADQLELERLEMAVNAERCIFTGNLLAPKLRDQILKVLWLTY